MKYQGEIHIIQQGWPKSLKKSRAGRHFYGTENEIWAGFGPIILRVVFSCFQGQKNNLTFLKIF